MLRHTTPVISFTATHFLHMWLIFPTTIQLFGSYHDIFFFYELSLNALLTGRSVAHIVLM